MSHGYPPDDVELLTSSGYQTPQFPHNSVYCQDDGTFTAQGTGFFVSLEPNHIYLVTALHVANEFPDGLHVMRTNPNPHIRAIEGYQHGYMEMQRVNRWYIHPDDATVDIAVTPLRPSFLRLLDHKTIPTSMFFLPEKRHPLKYSPEESQTAIHNAMLESNNPVQQVAQPIFLGDETYTVGLYSPVPGKNDNLPIIRVGNIAMMPGEPIPCKDGVTRELYLIEMISIGGFSGSPVFALSPITNTFFLIGVIHGHQTVEDGVTTLHTGITLVTPADKLLEILNQPELIELRSNELGS